MPVKTQSFNAERRGNTPRLTSRKGKWAAVIAICAAAISLRAQTTTPVEAAQAAQCAQAMQVPPDQLKTGVSELNAK